MSVVDQIDTTTGFPVTSVKSSRQPSGNVQFDKLIAAMETLDYATLGSDPVMHSLRIDLITQCIGDRATLRSLSNQDAVLIAKFKSFQNDLNLAGGADAAAGSLLAVAVETTIIPSGIGQIVGAVLAVGVLIFEAIDALTWWNRAKAWHNKLDTDVIGTATSGWDYTEGILGANLAGVSHVNEWHHLDKTEGEGALINLLPPYSDNPRGNIAYWYMCSTWIDLANALIHFYSSITLADYNALQKSYLAGQLLQEMPTSLESLAGLTNSVDQLLNSTSAVDLTAQVNALISTANKAGVTGSQPDAVSGYVLMGVGIIILIAAIFFLARGQT